MQTDEPSPSTEQPEEKVATEKKEEPSSYLLENPARVVPAQERLVSFLSDSRWRPVRGSVQPTAGIVILKDTRPGTSFTLASQLLCAIKLQSSGCLQD